MLGKNRDRVSIIAAILKAARDGSSKTHIMVEANLSFGLLEKYLDVAVEAELMQANSSRYHLTEHGHEFLREYVFFEERYFRAQKALETLVSERERLNQYCENAKLLQTIRSARTANM